MHEMMATITPDHGGRPGNFRTRALVHGVCLALSALGVLAAGSGAALAQQADQAAAVSEAGEARTFGVTAGEGGASAAAPDPAQPRVNINEYVVRGNTVLDVRAIEKAVYPFLGPGRTMTDIESAREALQAAYHDKGYQSVYVDLPEQQVSGGIVYLQVAETKVGRVRVVGAKHYSPLVIRDAVPSLQEGSVPDFKLAQEELSDLNRGASRQVMPMVREGAVPGTMDVDLKVEDRSPWHASVALNNDYSADTSKLRGMVTIGHDNLWQRGHSFSLTYFTAPRNTDDAKVWSGSYSLPLSDRWNLQLSGYHSNSNITSNVGSANMSVLGKGNSFGATATYTLDPAGSWYQSLAIGIDYKDFDENTRFADDDQAIPLKYVPITLSYNGYRFAESSQSSLGLSVVAAARSFFSVGSNYKEFDNKRYLANPSFALLKGDASHLQTVFTDWQLSLRGGFQIASGALVSNEQMSAGGASSVRGYLSAERSADDGFQASLEWRTPSLSRWLGSRVNEWRFYAFFDYATLRLRDPLPEQDASFHLASVGLGTRFQVFDWLSGGIDWGYPLRDGSNTRRHDPRWNFNVRASF